MVPIESLTLLQRSRTYALMAEYFAGVTRYQFERDLAEKEWAILLADSASGEIQGFSTLMKLHAVADDQPVVAFFSGDTIVEQAYWGETALPRLWAQHVFALAARIRRACVYWFLICSGYKTYRFLPVFFREFFPTYTQPTPPAAKRLLDVLGRLKFPTEYDPARGIIRFAQPSPLRAGVAEIEPHRLQTPHIAFFAAANPGHVHGDELACIADLSPTNVTSAGRRMAGSYARADDGGVRRKRS
ncbi:MAG: hypothetical protein HY332_04810 [Chloroflexi bacterium]|nr:hypothetical protein [Chloroflexota bacterium]